MSVAELLAKRFCLTHRWILEATDAVDDAALRRSHGPHAPPIGFHVWHVARWADRVQSRLHGDVEVWHRDGVARLWGLGEGELGTHSTGMGLDDDASAALALPPRDLLLSYVRAAFEAADRGALALTDEDLERVIRDHYDKDAPTAQILIAHTGHASRHLGMIEALRGVEGEQGSATM